MKICGIIAEYNPFHNGHAFQIAETVKSAQSTHTVVVMSGNFTQRGEPACMPKQVRVRAALLNGADLVIELPVPWAAARSESFAFGAVSLLHALGCVDVLSFGSECGDLVKIRQIAQALDSQAFRQAVTPFIQKGMGFAQAREKAINTICGEASSLLRSPNDTLAIEYCKALDRLHSPIEPFAVKRIGAGHDSLIAGEAFSSASYLRKHGISEQFVPQSALDVYQGASCSVPQKIEVAVLAQLRRMSLEEFRELPDISEGLENRIYYAVREGTDLQDVIGRIKTKRYSHARIRRILLSAFLGINKLDMQGCPPYIRILGFNAKGREILTLASQTAEKPIYSRTAALLQFGGRCFALECLAADLYALSLEKVLPCGSEQRSSLVIL